MRPFLTRPPARRGLRRAVAIFAVAMPGLPATALAQSADAASAVPPPSKLECASSFEQSQRLRQAFKYVEATAEALRCASPECGAALSEECGKMYGELQAATPSIVLVARAEDGSDLTGVRVSLDGREDSLSVDGTPVLLDPGSHEFTFAAPGFEAVRQATVVRVGERFRPVIGVLKPRPPKRSSIAPPRPLAPALRPTISPVTYLLGGVGVIGLAGFVGLRLAGASQYENLARSCKPACTDAQVDQARQLYTWSYVGLAVGAAASVTAVTLYLTSDRRPAPRAALQVHQLRGGVAAELTGTF